MIKEKEILLGTFENKSGTLIVSDPCYDLGTWCQGIIENAKKKLRTVSRR